MGGGTLRNCGMLRSLAPGFEEMRFDTELGDA